MADTTSGGKSAFELVLGKATDKFDPWQQIPAWVLGGAALWITALVRRRRTSVP